MIIIELFKLWGNLIDQNKSFDSYFVVYKWSLIIILSLVMCSVVTYLFLLKCFIHNLELINEYVIWNSEDKTFKQLEIMWLNYKLNLSFANCCVKIWLRISCQNSSKTVCCITNNNSKLKLYTHLLVFILMFFGIHKVTYICRVKVYLPNITTNVWAYVIMNEYSKS